jgi:outer membrane protein OmpA-like peptidoglycan-associated protein
MRRPFKRSEDDSVSFDLTISDLMAALVLIFILILSTQFLEIKKQSTLASEFREKQQALILALKEEFKDDLAQWSAEIDEKTLVIRFRNEDPNGEKIGFDPDSSVLKVRFKQILDVFFPRYINVLMRDEFKDSIDEIRIEGHTANRDEKYSNPQGYADSIRQSQERANNVLFHVLGGMDQSVSNNDTVNWVRGHLAASGYAFSKPVKQNEIPDWDQSRRVEFRIRTNYEELIQRLIEVSSGGPVENQ